MDARVQPVIDLSALMQEAREQTSEALLEVLMDAQEALITGFKKERLPDGSARYVGNGTYEKPVVTSFGGVRMRVQRLIDRLRECTVSPFLDALDIRGKRYTNDLRLACAEEATRTSYREAEQSVQSTTGIRVPARTIWNFVQDLARVAERVHKATLPRKDDKPHVPDSTEVRSQKRWGHHQVHVDIVQDPRTHAVELRNVKVNGPAKGVFEGKRVNTIVSDDDPSLRSAAATYKQLCHRHFPKRVGFLLWQDKVPREERRTWLNRLGAILGTLRNSVAKNTRSGNVKRLRQRIRTTLDELRRLAKDLETAGYAQAARFVRNEGRATVVFAELALTGVWTPSTTNGAERVMGMIADRCKRKWAHWGSGLRNLVFLLLLRKTRPSAYARTKRIVLHAT